MTPIKNYSRERDLVKLFTLFPEELADTSREGTIRIIKNIEARATRARMKAKEKHYAYSFTHHRSLLRCLASEQRNLLAFKFKLAAE